MEETKNKIIKILNDGLGDRDGKKDLIAWLETTDFFTAPASTMFHGNIEGGLAEHSLNVYELLAEKVKRYNLDISMGTIVICGLLHDVNKTNFYKKDFKWVKDDGKWIQKEIWVVDDKFPSGHGEKSVFLIQKFINLTDEEILAIRWHMGNFDPGISFNYPSGFPFRQSQKSHKLVTLLMTADMEAMFILEKIKTDD